jgi:hypothetical protein
MFNNGLPDSSLVLLHFVALSASLPSAHMTCTFCSSTFYALCTMSIHCTVPLLCNSAAALSSFFTHESPSPTTTTTTPTTTTTLLFSVPCIYSFCASCACNIRNASACTLRAKFLCNLSALSDHHRDSSASLVIFHHASSITGCSAEISQPL